MYIVLGSTGHVGSALAEALLSRGATVAVVARNQPKARALQARGARLVIADIRDVDSLRRGYRHGEHLFMLNPPADPSTDTQARERETVANMLRALEGSGLRRWLRNPRSAHGQANCWAISMCCMSWNRV
ncbi:MAG: SDR family oxidoreductase [Steroidobacteraceae bacterium]